MRLSRGKRDMRCLDETLERSSMKSMVVTMEFW